MEKVLLVKIRDVEISPLNLGEKSTSQPDAWLARVSAS
jgi:hypothetical protein